YFEKQRATAAAQAADFERTLGQRRDKITAEFTAQMATQEESLKAAQERAGQLTREAEEDRSGAAAEAKRMLEAARTEATNLVRSAKDQADRVRRDSERELAAVTARRDSITAQLGNVRNMLATLGGAQAVGLVSEPVAAAETADQTPSVDHVETTDAGAPDPADSDVNTSPSEAPPADAGDDRAESAITEPGMATVHTVADTDAENAATDGATAENAHPVQKVAARG
ncbi:MAG: hypothetical protein ACRCXL_00160, partial [Dermatophilaceae bacterium]